MGTGFIHASWALGTAIVSALRIEGGAGAEHFLTAFVNYNKNLGEPLIDVRPRTVAMPDILERQKLPYGQTEPIFLFLTPDAVSPVAREMRRAYAEMRNATRRQR